jgi:hypothetical protein
MYGFTKVDGPKLEAETMDYFNLFLNEDPMCKIVTETDKCAKEICYKLHSPR